MEKFLRHGVKFRNSVLESNGQTEVPMDNQILESDEEESFRYVAGYILYSLNNSIKNSDPYLKKEASGIIGIWDGKKDMGCSNNMTFQEYKQCWVEKVNRGRLIYVTDDFYKFIRKIEYTVREVLNMKLIVAFAGENLRSVLLGRLKEKNNLNEDWDLITSRLSNKNLAEKIKVKIFKTRINIREDSFVKTCQTWSVLREQRIKL